MVDWNDTTIRLIVYWVYGTSFIIMFLAMTLWKDRVSKIEIMNNFKYLAAFGLIHGMTEYSDIPRLLAWQPAWIFDLIKLILVSSSFTVLLVFGLSVVTGGNEERRWLRGIPYGGLLMFFWLLIFAGLDYSNGGIGINYKVADLAERYSLGFFGAAITSFALLNLSKKMYSIVGEKAGQRFIYAGFGFALYAIFGGLITTTVFGVPVIVYRAVTAILITITVIGIFQLFEVKRPAAH
jgi:hypothetical protein